MSRRDGKSDKMGEKCADMQSQRTTEEREKAYDWVLREEMWFCIRKSGAAEKYVRFVQGMCESCKTVVRCVVDVTSSR